MARSLRCSATRSLIGCNLTLSRVAVRAFSVRGSPTRQSDTTSAKDNQQNTQPSIQRSQQGRVIFSGIQPTGVPHLGNYLGALRQWKQFQDQKTHDSERSNDSLIFSVVDLHALTHHQEPSELLRNRRETFASLLAIGLDPKYSHVYCQSDIPGHVQLMWYLSNVASTGYLSRMTQWKSKLGVSEKAHLWDVEAREKLRLGLFSYPVLQAADILLYKADLVPVGEDQQQHVEFARNLARSFNAQYRAANNGKDFFKEPELLISPAKKIMSLKDPTVKMSKSDPDPNSRILITDDEKTIHGKIRKALTDSVEGISYEPTTRPGVSNLVEILKHVDNSDATCESIAQDNVNHSMRAFKEHVAQRIIACLDGVREKYLQFSNPHSQEMTQAINESRYRVTKIAGNNMKQVERLMGLRGFGVMSKSEITSKTNKKKAVIQEQEYLEAQNESEPDVTPQKEQGVDIPIAS